jgi:uncharacterized Fe-S cluster protein YjdI
MKKTYENKKIRVIWDSEKCYHSANCLTLLPKVFNPAKKPWVDISAAEAQEIACCIDKCPSGALSYKILDIPSNGLHDRRPDQILNDVADK